jgi:hypothetical protein
MQLYAIYLQTHLGNVPFYRDGHCKLALSIVQSRVGTLEADPEKNSVGRVTTCLMTQQDAKSIDGPHQSPEHQMLLPLMHSLDKTTQSIQQQLKQNNSLLNDINQIKVSQGRESEA